MKYKNIDTDPIRRIGWQEVPLVVGALVFTVTFLKTFEAKLNQLEIKHLILTVLILFSMLLCTVS